MKKIGTPYALSLILAASLNASVAAAQVVSEADTSVMSLREKAADKIKKSKISASLSGRIFKLDIDQGFSIGSGIRYRYILDEDFGKYLREDRWSDYIRTSFEPGIVALNQEIKREISFGRFFDQWSVALKTFLFTPLDLKKISSTKIVDKMLPGDIAAITLFKGTFLGIHGGASPSIVDINGTVGKMFTGKIMVKLLKKVDNKVNVVFSNADTNEIKFAAEVKPSILGGIFRLRFLSLDYSFHIRGSGDLASYTYDLTNPKAREVIDRLLNAVDKPTILLDKDILKEVVSLSPHLRDGLIDVTHSELASLDPSSGVTKEQKVSNSIAAGHRSRVRFGLSPLFFQNNTEKEQTINLIDVDMYGNFIKPGQYLVGYKSVLKDSRMFGSNSKIHSVTSIVYKPESPITDPNSVKGYRGLDDLIGISYHTDARERTNPKEIVTYAKLCNSGILSCPTAIILRVVSPDGIVNPETPSSADISQTIPYKTVDTKDDMPEVSIPKIKSGINSNYYFSKGLFEKIKQRLNWDNLTEDMKKSSLRSSISPIIKELVIDLPENKIKQSDVQTNQLVSLFMDVFNHNCYSNLVGINAKAEKAFFKKLFSNQCARNLYSISDPLVRLNMPSLLLSLYDPELLPPASAPIRRASDEKLNALKKYFTVNFNSNMVNTEGVETNVAGASFGQSIHDNTNSAQVFEFTSLISNWQQRSNMELDQFDRQRMLKERVN